MAAQEQRDVPKIILIPHSRSHPFAQRDCIVSEPQKVGRPVDKKKISQNNLIFDCRVLSRNHAVIWFENGKFYIRDTKSSNGTFVNDCRLSPSGEESPPREMRTRDVVQFGVNVNVEKKGESGVTHGCIIATVKLYINDTELPGPDPDIQQVLHIIQNSLAREQELETKLAYMQEVLVATHEVAKESMISIMKEDELLSRLQMLENQLQTCSRNVTETDLQKQLKKTLEEKHKQELVSKERIDKVLTEKADSIAKVSQLQRDYDKAEEECQKYRMLYESLKQEHSQQVCKLNESLKVAEKQRTDLEAKVNSEKDELIASKESLEVNLDFTKNELDATKVKLKEASNELAEIKRELQSSNIQSIKDNIMIERSLANETVDKRHSSIENGEVDERMSAVTSTSLYSSNDHQDDLRGQLNSSEEKVKQLTEEMVGFNLEQSSLKQELNSLRDQLKEKVTSERDKSQTISDLKLNIEEQREELEKLRTELSLKQQTGDIIDSPNELNQYKDQLVEYKKRYDKILDEREKELSAVKEEKNKLEGRIVSLQNDHNELIKENRQRESELQSELLEVQNEANSLNEQLHQLQETLAETMANSIQPSMSESSSSEVSLLGAGVPPQYDPRLRVLSIITLVSIAVALVSTAFAYLF